ncbi:hypothetical protein FA13DRAFT_1790539 [Coprinellus micaceus]|uniref:PIG-F-domain-containing protein n=1 Tax=Coprinellus micaceus TaxID=71717 RepID=A0A4Y7TH09_COPMI|nr:hypothetical protein FA13DRAFT_1790539 [Coprinellus micaceus]
MPRAQKSSKTGAKPKPQEETVQQRQKHVSLSTYISMVGVHTTLLGYAGLFLPRTTVLQQLALYEADAAVLSSQDRPQPSFFNALTRSPTITLFALCLGALILQTWWSSWLRACSIDISSHRSEEDKLKEKYLPTGQKAKGLAQAYGIVILTSIVLHFILILFGAPITELIMKTYLLALFISILTNLTRNLCVGRANVVERSRFICQTMDLGPAVRRAVRALVYPWVGAVLGSWIGVIPIALDWDRPWQAWPLTPAYGALLGYILSSVTAVTVEAIFQNPIDSI